jgi:hypothetical protein
MSLHKFAEQVASQGRGDDSLLVHMTPDEVQRLQSFAQANGTTLTINPTTGLPEAGFLSDLFKAVAPIALGAFLGPGAFGIAGLGLSAGTAGLVTGGLTTLATGSLSRGLMAGMGAYGGAGLAQGFMDAGANALGSQGVAGALGVEGAATGANSQAAMLAQQTAGFGSEGLSRLADSARVATGATPVLPSASDLMSKGISSAATNPMDFAKANWKPIAAAALPVLSAIGTTTPGPTASPMAPGRIREKRWDGRQFVDVANTDASVYNTSGRSFSDLYRGYNGGGIVALAEGGDVIRMANGTPPKMLSDEQLYQASGLSGQAGWEAAAKARDAQNAALTQYYNPIATDYVNTAAANPKITASDFITGANTAGFGLTQPLTAALQGSGLSQSAQYALTHRLDDAAGVATAPKATQDFYNNMGYIAGALPGDQGGLSGLYANINYSAKGLQDQINAGTLSVADAQKLARGEMTRVGVNERDIKGATGKSLDELFREKPITKVIDTFNLPTTPSGYHVNDSGVFVPNISSTQNTTTDVAAPTDLYTAPATSLPVGVSGNTGPSQIGGGATVNPNGTITTSPRIPGIPVGGFTGSKNLRDTYTKGGGSLGFAPKAPETMDEFNTMFNKQTGDSLAAYNYLTGKAGAAYPIKSGVGQIARPYDEAVLGYPARGNLPYIYNKVTGKMDVNPDYVAPGRDAAGNVTYSMSLNDIKKALTDAPLSGQALYDWAKSNNLSAQQIADATGRSLSSVYADFRAGSKAATTATTTTTDTTNLTDQSKPPTTDPGSNNEWLWDRSAKKWYISEIQRSANGGLMAMGGATGYALGGLGSLGTYSDGGRLLRGPGDGVSDSIPATIGNKQQPARLADGEFVVPARIVSELGNGSTDAGAKKLYAMLDRVQRARGKTTGKNKVAANSRADKYLPA